ncbi:tetratricopeptide repeat protein [Azospirillum sp.]|uniref:tetratricopeptide repeat protein n=1 Tax=Azospirillum sp. TaxID=34012 RepID=UPI002D56969F|nr:tetratricopeptide repeat protein [Azospirillum sp.]HYD64581.1 tetratricopeptide repeat protein [Azospirillum sp.]
MNRRSKDTDQHARMRIIKLVQADELEAALALCRAQLDASPDDPCLTYATGWLLRRLDRAEPAAALFMRTLELTPQHVQSYFELGCLFWEAKQPNEAAVCWMRAITLQPDLVDAHTSLGTLLMACNRPVEALACFHNATLLRPAMAPAQYNVATLLLGLDRPREALERYEQAVAADPTYLKAQGGRLLALIELRNQGGPWDAYEASRPPPSPDFRAIPTPAPEPVMVYYRISGSGRPDHKTAGKKTCLRNFLDTFRPDGAELRVIADNATDDLVAMVRRCLSQAGLEPDRIVERTSLGNSLSWRYVRDLALELDDGRAVYLLEDDYLHLEQPRGYLLEGLARADYVTLYDHADKYLSLQDSRLPHVVRCGGELTRVIRTPSSHWKFTASTTMTFAARAGTLRADRAVWDRWTAEGMPQDYCAFFELQEKGRFLISVLPGRATHVEPEWLSPGVDWAALAVGDHS